MRIYVNRKGLLDYFHTTIIVHSCMELRAVNFIAQITGYFRTVVKVLRSEKSKHGWCQLLCRKF